MSNGLAAVGIIVFVRLKIKQLTRHLLYIDFSDLMVVHKLMRFLVMKFHLQLASSLGPCRRSVRHRIL